MGYCSHWYARDMSLWSGLPSLLGKQTSTAAACTHWKGESWLSHYLSKNIYNIDEEWHRVRDSGLQFTRDVTIEEYVTCLTMEEFFHQLFSMLYKVFLTLKSVDETLVCDHYSNAVMSCDTVY